MLTSPHSRRCPCQFMVGGDAVRGFNLSVPLRLVGRPIVDVLVTRFLLSERCWRLNLKPTRCSLSQIKWVWYTIS